MFVDGEHHQRLSSRLVILLAIGGSGTDNIVDVWLTWFEKRRVNIRAY